MLFLIPLCLLVLPNKMSGAQEDKWGLIFVAVKPSLGILCVSFKEFFGGERMVSDKYILTLICSELPTEQIQISV